MAPDRYLRLLPTILNWIQQTLDAHAGERKALSSFKFSRLPLEGTDEAGWEAQIESGEAAREDMERMARPDYHRGHGKGVMQGPQLDPNANRLNKAIPHVRAMLTAMQNRDRVAAMEHGRLALAVM